MSDEWTVRVHKEVKKKHIPLLEKVNLLTDYDEVIEILKRNPFTRVRNFEKLNPKHKEIFSMRINSKHRVVYTVDKKSKIVKVWAAWSHYENNVPR